MPQTFGDRVIDYNSKLHYTGKLPKNIRVLNPFLDNPETMQVMQAFYQKYYNDYNTRKLILGINPGRHGAAVTGVPFTDTKRLESVCGIKMNSARSHEVSSVFIYDMIEQYGGAVPFYRQFYINSLFPLAIVRKAPSGRWLNCNYYDYNELYELLKEPIIATLKAQIKLGVETSDVYIMGKKNGKFIEKLNNEVHLFERLHVLDHPRYIQQYKSKEKQQYIDIYLHTLKKQNVL